MSLIIILFLVFVVHPVEVFSFTGQVVGVLDGDTIEVLPSGGLHNKTKRVRLYGIDCPEKKQAFGTRAKQAMSALVFAKSITVESLGQDKYKRIVGDVFLPDGTNVNRELVAQGWCWHYEKYAPDDLVLAVLELAARGSKKGLWADTSPLPPWEWRKARRGKRLELSELP
jgi:micrococcal nuclease